MAANNPYQTNAATIQGPGPTGNEGFPVPVVGAPGGAAVNVSVVSGGGGAVTIADGADVCEGAKADAGVTGDTAGTVSAKLRGLNIALTPQALNGPTNPAGLSQAGVVAFLKARDATDGNFYPLNIPDAPAADGVAVTAIGNLLAVWSSLRVATAPDSWDGLRTPNKFFTVATAANGNTALWTPAAGKKFRLMRYRIDVTGNAAAAAAAVKTISLFDGAAGATGQAVSVFVPGAALAGAALYTSGWIDLGNGYLSAAANNVLNVNLSTALTAGVVRVIACGTEE